MKKKRTTLLSRDIIHPAQQTELHVWYTFHIRTVHLDIIKLNCTSGTLFTFVPCIVTLSKSFMHHKMYKWLS